MRRRSPLTQAPVERRQLIMPDLKVSRRPVIFAARRGGGLNVFYVRCVYRQKGQCLLGPAFLFRISQDAAVACSRTQIVPRATQMECLLLEDRTASDIYYIYI